MAGVDRVTRAELQVREARSRFERTLGTLQERTSPKRLADDAIAGVKQRSAALAETAVSTVQAQPGLFALGAAGIGAFLARGAIAAGLRRLFKRKRRRHEAA